MLVVLLFSTSSAMLVDTASSILHASKATTVEDARADCLSGCDVFALFQRAIEQNAPDILHDLLHQQLHHHPDGDLTIKILRRIVDEGNAALLETFFTSQDVEVSIDTLRQDEEARPPLHVAVEQDNTELVAVLLRHPKWVDVDEIDMEIGWTALHYAVEWDSVPMQTRLIQAGANINACARDGVTPLHLAVQFGHTDSATFLVDSGADISIPDSSGSTPLHTAAREGHTALIEYLLRHDAQLDALDHEGRTPLHVAAFYDESAARFARSDSDTQVAVVRKLLAHGADVHARDAHGNTALLTAQQGRFDIIVDVLLAHQSTKSSPAK